MSPTRVELVDPAAGALSSAWRPQEALGTRVFDSIVANLQANEVSPVKQRNGKRAELGFAILTGDIADSQQYNEVTWFRDLLDGKTVDPYSGKAISAANPCPGASPATVAQLNDAVAKRQYVGVQDFADYPGQTTTYPGFWDPNVGGTSNEFGYGGFPKYPGLMDQAQTPMDTAGLDVPWYISRGNHDALVQGNLPANTKLKIGGLNLGLDEFVTGCLKPWPNDKFDPRLLIGIQSEQVFSKILSTPALVGGIVAGLTTRRIPPDPDRRYVSKATFKQMMGSGDRAHGFGYVDAGENKASNGNASYYGFTKGRFRFLMLDSNAEGGGSSGNLDDPQYRWLRHQLDKYSSVRISNGKVKRDNDQDKLLVIASHHTLATMNNPTPDENAGTCTDPLAPGCDSDPRDSQPIHLGEAGKQPLKDLLLAYPNVVAYVNGHTHRNVVTPFARPRSWPFKGGFWQVNTASHVDWPQQSRLIELMDNRDGTLSIFGTILNSAAPIAAPKPGTDAGKMSNAQLASLSRLISANDPQTGPANKGNGIGTRQDRNVELILKDPRTLWR